MLTRRERASSDLPWGGPTHRYSTEVHASDLLTTFGDDEAWVVEERGDGSMYGISPDACLEILVTPWSKIEFEADPENPRCLRGEVTLYGHIHSIVIDPGFEV